MISVYLWLNKEIGKFFLSGIVKKNLIFSKLGYLLSCNPGGRSPPGTTLHAMQENNLLSIQEVSNMLKLPKPTLRFWEKELDGIFMPFRTRGGQRRYNLETISVIEEIKRLRERGMSLSEINRKLGKGQMSEAGSQTCPPSRATLNILYPFVDSLRRGGRACPQRSRHARHREAQPRRTGLRGGRGSGDERTDRVDLLAARVAEVVRAEVNRFFEGVGTELD